MAQRRRNYDGRQDQSLSTRTHGVLGVISRTAEYEDKVTSNNEDFYYLSDAMGNHAGVINSSGNASVREFDAFGRHRGELILSGSGYYRVRTGPYMWRGGEGSESDLYTEQDFSPPADITVTAQSTGLVHMGVRYYEPETGRFTQRDSDELGNALSMNPYAYSDNDPVNASDPSGSVSAPVIMAIIGIILILLSLLKALAKNPVVKCWLKKKGVSFLTDSTVDLLTGLSPLQWLGAGLIALGALVTFGSAGLLFPVGGVIALGGGACIVYDRAKDAAIEWVVNTGIDWLMSDARKPQDRRGCGTCPWFLELPRSADYDVSESSWLQENPGGGVHATLVT